MTDGDNIKFMRRCLELAGKAEGMTYPNPMVGSVIVHNGVIIGEGFHLKAGEPHAEVNAINSVKDKALLRNAVLYVNLEPCSHYGKTPPCAEYIASAGIKTIVIGSIDTNSKVSGKGIAYLEKNSCNVQTGIMEEECRWLNRRFFTFHEKKRPYIILKWAQSYDGYIDVDRSAGVDPGPYWITGNSEKVLVHKWRATEQAILVGGETIRNDNPKLNVREWTGNDPLKLILSRSGNLSAESEVFKNNGSTVIFTSNSVAKFTGSEKVVLIDEKRAATEIAEYLFTRGLLSLFIEGGAETINHFINLGLWDEARIFCGNVPFNQGKRAPAINGMVLAEEKLSGSLLKLIANK